MTETNKKEVIICRCEDVSEVEIKQAIEEGFTTINAIKKRLRTGMGLCQGRTCQKLVARIIAQETGKSMEEILLPTTRPPVRPIIMGAFEGEDQ